MEINVKTISGITVVDLEGRLDTVTASEVEKKILPLLAPENKKLILDCAKLAYISSSGLRLILMIFKKAKSLNGNMVLCNMIPSIKEVFNICGFANLLTITEDLVTAVNKI